MTTLVPKTPFGYTIFCDDVRQEINGKLIYIGIYQADMVVYGTAPTAVPMLCAVVTYRERPGESDDPVTVKLFGPGNENAIAEVNLQLDQLRHTPPPEPPADENNPDRMISVMVPIKMQPAVIPKEGLFKVRAYRGADEFRLGTLRVTFQPLPTI